MLIVISAVIGIAAQTVLPNGIGLKTDLVLVGTDSNQVSVPAIAINPRGDETGAENISLAGAYLAHQNGSALFLDARSSVDYDEGHIEGAINLPAHAFMDSLAFLENLNFDSQVITYCDGADCNASIDLAADLKMMGFTSVVFFFGGWQEWQTAAYPVESSH
ncbi:MAG: hypothetical protein HQ508_03890 [Candidatus Marinimicrobia bacterium]|nr:hypothetical protein [Candidatus Neomarinimicrobiota bacterium]